jgi:quaternary ammonium compound-resistance protein SugE
LNDDTCAAASADSSLVPTDGKTMDWLLLFLAGLMEIFWAIGLKYTEGFTRLWWSIWTIVEMIASYVLLAPALKTIPVGTAYAAWTGIGAVGVAVIGMLFLGEPRTAMRILCIVLIVLGIVGLKLFGGGTPA